MNTKTRRKTTQPTHTVVAPVKTAPPVQATKRAIRPSKTEPLNVAVSPFGSEQARLISMLTAASGATLEQMMNLTGWQAHTVRGAISGVLRRRLGLNVVCSGSAGHSSKFASPIRASSNSRSTWIGTAFPNSSLARRLPWGTRAATSFFSRTRTEAISRSATSGFTQTPFERCPRRMAGGGLPPISSNQP